MELNN
jgi:geranylgeranyl transferase type-2 subunit beta